jgi:hypothetical protein
LVTRWKLKDYAAKADGVERVTTGGPVIVLELSPLARGDVVGVLQ